MPIFSNVNEHIYNKSTVGFQLSFYLDWVIPDKLCPPPIEDVSTIYAKSRKLHLLHSKISLEIQSEKTNMDFEHLCEFFLEICVKIKIFV